MPEKPVIQTQLYAIALAICCFWVALPFGSVTLWAKSLAPALILSVVCFGLVCSDSRQNVRGNRHWMLLVPLGVLAVWSTCQLIPLPVSWLKTIQPNAAPIYDQLFSTAEKTTISNHPNSTWNTCLLWLSMLWLAWTCSRNFHSRSTLRSACLWIAILGTTQAVAGFVTPEMTGASFRRFFSGRFIGTFSGPNTFGGYLAITLPVTLGTLLTLIALILDEPEKTKFRHFRQQSNIRTHVFHASWLTLATLLQVVALILSSSRSALLITACTTVLLFGWFGWVNKKKARSRNTLWAFLALVVIVVILLGVGGTYSLTVQRFSELTGAGGRWVIWKSAWEMIMLYPLGVGFGAFPAAFPRFQPDGFGRTRFDHAHNDYLQLIGEWGWIGAVVLLCLLVWIAGRILHAMRRRSNDQYTWIHRGIALAVTAALVQATVEFNLTSRPGVQILFMFTMGLLCSSSDIGQRKKASTSTSRRQLFILPLAALSLVACIHLAWRASPTVTDAENAWAVLGESGDPYFWKPNAWLKKEQALEQVQAAAQRAPSLERVQHLLGQTHLLLHKEFFEEQLDAMQRAEPNIPYETLESRLLSSIRRERSDAFNLALSAFDIGIRYNPWSIDLRAERARALYETAFSVVDPAKRERQLAKAEQEVDTTLQLAPHDLVAQTKICQALAAAYEVVPMAQKEQVKSRLKHLGYQVLREDPSFHLFISSSWSRADIGLSDMLAIPGIPPNLYREQFRILNQGNDAEASLACLAAWEVAMQDPAWPERLSEEAVKNLERSLNKSLTRGWARWLIRTAQWQEYARRAKTFFTKQISERKTLLASYEDGSLKHRLALKKFVKDNRATRANKIELYRLLSPNDSARPSDERIASFLLSPELEPSVEEAFHQLFNSVGGHISPLVRKLWDISLSMKAGDFAAGQAELTALLASHKLTLRTVHRAYWLLALCELELGQDEAALAAYTDACEKATTDPLVLQSMAEAFGPDHLLPNGETIAQTLDMITAQNEVHVSFQAGDILLTGIDVEPMSSDQTPPTLLSVYLQFFDHVSPDLSLDVTCFKDNNYVTFRQRTVLKNMAPVDFGAGTPQIGCVLVVETELPSFVYGSSLLRIRLHSAGAKTGIRTDDELRYLEIEAWEKLGH